MTQTWLDSLDPERRERAESLLRQFRDQGADHPLARTRSELEHNMPQLARFLLLRHLWTEAIDPWRDHPGWMDTLRREAETRPEGAFRDAGQALAKLLDLGAEPADLGALARFVAFEAVFSVLHTLDEGYDPEHDGPLPGWALLERDPLGQITGRRLARLHTDLLDHDPSGREGCPA